VIASINSTIHDVRLCVARLLLYYSKRNEQNQKDMIPFLDSLIKDISNKQIPKMLAEIMSCFYKDEGILKYIDTITHMLLQTDNVTNQDIKILKVIRSLVLDKFGIPIFKN